MKKNKIFTDELFSTLNEYKKRFFFDVQTLKMKYRHSFSDKKILPTVSCDVVIAGGGPSGLMYGAYMVKHGFTVKIIEPNDIGVSTREWNISLDELLYLECILTREEIMSCIKGEFVSNGHFGFMNYLEFECTNTLDKFVDVEKILLCLKNKIITLSNDSEKSIFIKAAYRDLKYTDEKVYVYTSCGDCIEGELFLHGMGALDEIFYYGNHNRGYTYYTIVGFNGIVGESPRKSGELFEIIDFANYGHDQQQLYWEFLRSETRNSDEATIYLFAMTRKPLDIVELMEYFEDNVHNYAQCEIVNIKKPLYGYVRLPNNYSSINRSVFPRTYTIGEANINSVVTACGFGMTIKTLDIVGRQLVNALVASLRGPQETLSKQNLNKIKPDNRLLCSVGIEQMFKDVIIRDEKDSVDRPVKSCAIQFKLLNLIKDPITRSEMLKSHFKPHVLLEMFECICTDESLPMDDFLQAFQSPNKSIDKKIKDLCCYFFTLYFCEIKEIFKHFRFWVRGESAQRDKMFRHLNNVYKAHPIYFFKLYNKILKRIIKSKRKTNMIKQVMDLGFKRL